MNRRASDEQNTTAQRGEPGDGSKAVLEEEKERAREAAHEAADRGKERLESQAHQAAEGVDHVAEAVGTAASRLSEMEHEGLADHANRLASWLGDMSERLRHKNVDEITADIRRVAERNPALFVLGSVAVGLGLSRFAKASSDRGGQGSERQRFDSAGGDSAWRGRAGAADFAEEPSMAAYESRDRNASDRPADRPMTPDSSGGGGL